MQGTKALRGMYAVMVIGATALVAYSQSLGVNMLVEASLMLPPPSADSAPPDVVQHVSVTEAPRAELPELRWGDAPECEGFELSIVSQAVDPRASAATVRRSGDSSGRLLRRGSKYYELQLLRVGYDAHGVTPAVWFHRNYELCQLRMFSSPKAQVVSEERAAVPTEQPAARGGHDAITPLGPGSFQVDRALVDRLLAAPGATRDAFARFERGPRGTFALEFRRVHPSGWAHALGLKVGDRLTSVNGYELKDPRHAIEAYAALRETHDLVLKLERSGKVETILECVDTYT